MVPTVGKIMSRTTDADVSEPAPPADLATYVHEPIARQDIETLREIAAWCSDLANHREAQPIEADLDEGDTMVDIEKNEAGKGLIVSKLQQCGKDCSGCPHGPYDWHVTGSGTDRHWECLGRTDER